MSILEKAYYSPLGARVAARAGLAEPPELRRGGAMPAGPIILAAPGGGSLAADTMRLLGRAYEAPVIDTGEGSAPAYGSRIGAVVIDAAGVERIAQLEELRAILRPAMRGLEASGRVVLLAPEPGDGWEARAVSQALEGLTRTVAKELRRGATANLVRLRGEVTPGDLAPTLSFALEGRSAYVDGQAWTLAATGQPQQRPARRPLDGCVIAVTGAARGIGASIAHLLAQQGADVVAIDIPATGDSLAHVANEVGGTALQLDVTADDAGARIADHVAQRGSGLHGIVHNAGITRDKMLANLDQARWGQVLEVNLAAQTRINEVLLEPGLPGGLVDGGRIVGVASMVGIGGNKGQANYASSKAGVIGLVRAMAPDLAERRITVNAVAPGFIETEMTARIPFVQREIMRRTNSLAQGGSPVDVAETIAYFLDPRSAGVTGQIIRVCGQNLMGK